MLCLPPREAFFAYTNLKEGRPIIKFKGAIIRLCKKSTRKELLELIDQLIKIPNDKNSEIKPKDDFKEKHPNYRSFKVNPLAPLNASQFSEVKAQPWTIKILWLDMKKNTTNQ